MELFDAVGMADQGHKLPTQISCGQKQRVAMAGALITNPEFVLVDELTVYKIIALRIHLLGGEPSPGS